MKVFMQAHRVWNMIKPSDAKAAVKVKSDKVVPAKIYQGIPGDVLLALAEEKRSKRLAKQSRPCVKVPSE